MRERGSVTFWILGLSFAVMSLGVLSVDLWALISERKELTSLADAAATAAASAVDENEWRSSQRLRLDPPEARRRARAALEVRGSPPQEIEQARIAFGADGVTVRVALTRTVETALLGLAGRETVTIGAASEAMAVLHD